MSINQSPSPELITLLNEPDVKSWKRKQIPTILWRKIIQPRARDAVPVGSYKYKANRVCHWTPCQSVGKYPCRSVFSLHFHMHSHLPEFWTASVLGSCQTTRRLMGSFASHSDPLRDHRLRLEKKGIYRDLWCGMTPGTPELSFPTPWPPFLLMEGNTRTSHLQQCSHARDQTDDPKVKVALARNMHGTLVSSPLISLQPIAQDKVMS